MCDACQRRKEEREFGASLGDDQLSASFEFTSMDITGPYVLTLRKKYLLTLIDNFTKCVEDIPISDHSAGTFARFTQVKSLPDTAQVQNSDQGRSFMSTFSQETCKILGIHKVNTTSYHPSSNRMIVRLYTTIHTALSHFFNSVNNNWDALVPFLMAYRATPNTTTKYNTFYLLQCREMMLPTNENLKAKIQGDNASHSHRLENLKASLRSAYKLVRVANSRSHRNNKGYYDPKPNFECLK
jgi:hypothetical protein